MTGRQDVVQHFESRLESMVHMVEVLARIESYSYDFDALEHCASILAEYGHAALGIEPQWMRGADGRPHLRLDLGESPTALLTGHFDTAHPMGTLKNHPVLRDGERLYGPGVLDMKSGLVVMIEVAHYLQQLHPDPNLTLVFDSDEEIASPSSGPLLRAIAKDADLAIALEFGVDAYSPKVAARGLRQLTFVFKGKSGHSAYPENYVNPVIGVADVLEVARGMHDPENGLVVSPTMVSGSNNSVTVAEEARLTVDMRASSDAALDAAEVRLRNVVMSDTRVRVEIADVWDIPTFEMRAENRCLDLARSAARQLGLAEPDATEARGGSEANQIARQVHNLMEGAGPWGRGAHNAAEEFVFVPSLVESASRLAIMLEEALGISHQLA